MGFLGSISSNQSLGDKEESGSKKVRRATFVNLFFYETIVEMINIAHLSLDLLKII